MASDDSILISVEIDEKSANSALKNLESNARKAGQRAGASLEGGLLASIGKLKGALLGLGAAFGAAFTLREAINAAAEQEQAIQNLNASLAAAGRFSLSARDSFIELANELQKTTGIADDQVLGLAALANNFAKTNEQAQALTKAAVDLSAATGENLETSLENLGKTLSGNVGLLSRTVPEVKNLTKAQLEAGEAIRIVQERFAGVAGSQLQTFSGSVRGAVNSFSDFLEEIGNFVVKSPSLITTINILSNSIQTLGKQLSDFRGGTDFFQPLLQGLAAFAVAVNALVVGPLEIIYQGILLVFNTLAASLGTIGLVIAQALEGYIKLAEAFGLGGAITENLKQFSGFLREEFVKASDSAKTSLNNLFNLPITNTIRDQIIEYGNAVSEAAAKTDDLANRAKKGLGEISKKTKKAEFDIRTRIGNGISSAIQEGVTALAKGQNAFAAFGKAVLGVFGDLAIQLGTFFIVNGIALSALEELKPAQAIATGAVLVAFGALLKAFSGGAGSIAGPSPTTPGVTGTPNDVTQPSPIDEQTQIERSSQVVVNVEGTVLDPIGVGTQIAQLLREVTDSNDIQVRA